MSGATGVELPKAPANVPMPDVQPTLGERPAAPAAIDPALLMHGWMLEVLGCTVRGTIATFHQRGAVDAILIAICRAMGSLMGRIYGGDVLEVMRFRRACRDAFKEAIKAEAVVGPQKSGA